MTAPVDVLLLAESNTLSMQAVYCLHAMGARIHVVGRHTGRQLRRSRYCTSYHDFDFMPTVNDPPSFQAWIVQLARRIHVDVLVPVGILSMTVAARIKAGLPFPCFPIPTEEALTKINDKWTFYEVCRDAGVPVPRTLLLHDKRECDPDRLGRELGYPLVVKPTNMGDRAGVVIAKSAAELRAQVVDNPSYAFAPLVAQEFIPGGEVDLNTLMSHDGLLGNSIQYRDGTTIVFEDQPGFAAHGAKILAAIGYEGLAHFDAIRDARDGSMKLLECNGRVWASIAASAYCGLNFFEAGIRYALDPSSPRLDHRIPNGSTFLPPAYALMHMAFVKRQLRPVSRASMQGLASTLADPMTFIAEYAQRLKPRPAGRF